MSRWALVMVSGLKLGGCHRGINKKTFVILKHAWNQNQRWKTFQNVCLDKKHELWCFDKKIEPCPYRQEILINFRVCSNFGVFSARCTFWPSETSSFFAIFRWEAKGALAILAGNNQQKYRTWGISPGSWETWWTFPSIIQHDWKILEFFSVEVDGFLLENTPIATSLERNSPSLLLVIWLKVSGPFEFTVCAQFCLFVIDEQRCIVASKKGQGIV